MRGEMLNATFVLLVFVIERQNTEFYEPGNESSWTARRKLTCGEIWHMKETVFFFIDFMVIGK